MGLDVPWSVCDLRSWSLVASGRRQFPSQQFRLDGVKTNGEIKEYDPH